MFGLPGLSVDTNKRLLRSMRVARVTSMRPSTLPLRLGRLKVGVGVGAVAGIAAAQVDFHFVARPVRLRPQFRRDGIEPGAAAVGRARRIGIVAADQLDRREKRRRRQPARRAARKDRPARYAPCVSPAAGGSARVPPAALLARGKAPAPVCAESCKARRLGRAMPGAAPRIEPRSAAPPHPAGLPWRRRAAVSPLCLALIFLRALVESKPVPPAPAAGAEKLAGGPSCTWSGRVNFWKRGGFFGSVSSLGASGSG